MSEKIKVTRERLPFTMFDNCVLEDDRLDKNDILVYLALAYHADATGHQAFPSKNTIARESRISKRTVDSAIEKLEQLHYITAIRKKQKDGKNFANLYTLTPVQAVNMLQGVGATTTPGVGATTAPMGATTAPELYSSNYIQSINKKYTPEAWGKFLKDVDNLRLNIESTFQLLESNSKLTTKNIDFLFRLIEKYGIREIENRLQQFAEMALNSTFPNCVYNEYFSSFLEDDLEEMQIVNTGKINFLGFSKMFQYIPGAYDKLKGQLDLFNSKAI